MSQQEVPPEARVWQLGLGFANTAVLYALVKTGVIEQMRHQSQPLDALAQACSLQPEMLFRVLRYATVIGLVASDGGQYFLTDTGKLLLKDARGSFYYGILVFGSDAFLRGWQNLDYVMANSGSAFEHAAGDPFFEYLEGHPDFAAIFNQWMTVSTELGTPTITGGYDFSPFRSVCDIGGGQGILLKSILLANPHLHGILYDQESVVKNNVLNDLDGRTEIQTGSFFDRVPTADVLIMKSVLHDWNDEQCEIILSHCRETMLPASRLLIVERVIATPADFMGAFFDLNMQVLAGGRERTADEFNALLQKAGLKLDHIIPTRSPWKIIETSAA